ncbi:MAG: LytTR family DNA-binding domain-containing protein [Oscillospiraceae bacterium]|jgi:DNA-binding LytR/AlgR family response regulator|nr:LytTR family DNA-binding domain-containing protein [Oscillospiraceae bacterium]
MRIAVVDDEEVFRNQISSEITRFFGRDKVSCFLYADGSEILRALELGLIYDAIFLDIEMKDMDGMTAAAEIRKIARTVPIVFLTGHTEMAMEGYEVAAFRFLGKPPDRRKLRDTLLDLEKHIRKEVNITLHSDGKDIVIPASSILYAESQNNEVRFVTSPRPVRARIKFSEAEKLLSETDCDFYKIHRCYIVNLLHIRNFSTTELHMDNGDILPIARSAAADFKNKMFESLKKNGR